MTREIERERGRERGRKRENVRFILVQKSVLKTVKVSEPRKMFRRTMDWISANVSYLHVS